MTIQRIGLVIGRAIVLLLLFFLPSVAAHAGDIGDFLRPYAGVRPVVGTRPILVILLQARDRPAAVAPATIRQRFFGTGPNESVATYFNEISFGRFGVGEAMVTPWLTATDDPGTAGIDESLAGFVYQHGHAAEVAKAKWLIEAVDRQTNFNFARFDINPRDGRVTAEELLVMWVYPADPADPQGGSGGRSRPADPWLIPVAGLSQGVEIRTLSRVGENANWRTIAHELLHQVHKLGDLYVDRAGGYPGVGPYSIMCASGGPVHLDPWAKMKLGWLVPEVVSDDGWIELNDIERWPQAFILHDPARGPKDYFIVENRWPGTSHEHSMSQGGLVIWRIEERHDNAQSDWARQTIDRIWPTGEPPPAQRAPDSCPHLPSQVFRGDDPAASYAVTPGSTPGRLRWRDGSSSHIGLWFVSAPGPRMRVYVDMPPPQVGLVPESMDFSIGSSRAPGAMVARAESALAAGRAELSLIDVGIAADGRAYAWYRDGTVSAGHSPADFGNYRPPARFVLPPGRTPYDIVAIAIAPDNHVYAWYRDGTVSAGSSRNLADYRPPRPFALPPGKSIHDVVGAGIAKSNSHVYMWYRDGTVSAGTSTDLDAYRTAQGVTLPPGRHPTRMRAAAIDPRDRVHVWYGSVTTLDVDLTGPVLAGAYLDPPAVQPGGSARVIVRALDANGRPIAADVNLSAQAGLFPGSSAAQVAGRASAAGYYEIDWRAPQAVPGGASETAIYGVVANAQRQTARFRLRVPLLLQPIR